MKNIIIIILMALASQISGQAIDSTGCTGAVGDVKYSVLELVPFVGENGDCWILMDGQAIAGSRLQALTSMNNAPDARGYFIRSNDNRQSGRVDVDRIFGSPIGVVQQDEFKSHNHGMDLRTNSTSSTNNQGITHGTDENDGDLYATHFKGGNETRPANINLYTYIRIN